MHRIEALSSLPSLSSPALSKTHNPKPKHFLGKSAVPLVLFNKALSLPSLSSLSCFRSPKRRNTKTHFTFNVYSSSSTVGNADYTVEPATSVKFQTSLSLPGCSSSLLLLGTGYREKVFAIIGVKVYAAGLYIDQSILNKLNAWKGLSVSETQKDSNLFKSLLEAPSEKSLQIVLVRDIDGKTFWSALDDAISPRVKSATPVDESALSTFRSTFQGRPLNKGTSIFLTWLEPSKMLVCVSSDTNPSSIDATIESKNVVSALFDVFFGDDPVSPSLKASVGDGLARLL